MQPSFLQISPKMLATEKMTIMPLGAGNEVGRSCIILNYKNKTIMLDCGIHPAYQGMPSLPFFDLIEPETVDLILVTHFHLDHAASLPYFTEKTKFRGSVYMTHPTKAICRWLLADSLKVASSSSEQYLYTEKDLLACYEKIKTIDYHQQIEFNGIKFTAYNAGHVLGAAMFHIEIAGVSVLYTGDYSCEEDRHLKAAEKPDCPVNVLICECTYGVQCHQSRTERENRFITTAKEIVTGGGKCLIPVFALGRAQELLLILDEYWHNNPELQSIPIYYASSLASKCLSFYQTYINMMNDRIRKQATISNPFYFKHIFNLKSIDSYEDVGPCIMIASPGMLQKGLSRQLFERWASSSKNGIIIPGYCVEGTLAKQILSEPSEIVGENGGVIQLRMSVDYISFSAHVDYIQNSLFIDQVAPQSLILVHGDGGEANRLMNALERKYGDTTSEKKMKIYAPFNSEAVILEFHSSRVAKMKRSAICQTGMAHTQDTVELGNLYSQSGGDKEETGIPSPISEHFPKTVSCKDSPHMVPVEGILVGKNFDYTITEKDDLSKVYSVKLTEIRQVCHFSIQVPFPTLEFYLLQMYGKSVQRVAVRESGDGGQKGIQLASLLIMQCVDLNYNNGKVRLEWEGNPINDLIADSVVSVCMLSCVAPSTVKLQDPHLATKPTRLGIPKRSPELVRRVLGCYFDLEHKAAEEAEIQFIVDGYQVTVDPNTLSIACSNTNTHKTVYEIMERAFLGIEESG